MSQTFDVIVIGLGAMGSAAAYHIAKRGKRVLGLDRFSPPHTLGSSHGETRIIREAYAEGPAYVKIVQRAFELWEELSEETDRELLQQTGGMFIGRPDGDLLTGIEISAKVHDLPFERISAGEIRDRFPVLHAPEDMAGIWDPRAGFLIPEACIESHFEMARRHGATLHFDEPAISWSRDGDGVIVTTGIDTYHSDKLLLSAGAWITQLSPDLNLPLTVERQVLFWFEAAENAALFKSERFPIFVWDMEDGTHSYGFPDIGTGVKVACMHDGEITDPDGVRRDVDETDEARVRDFLRRFIPDANGRRLAAEVCMFTNTPDLDFLIDFHPGNENVVIASPCSGHGFKFASAMGEIFADMLLEGRSRFDLSMFRLDRFSE